MTPKTLKLTIEIINFICVSMRCDWCPDHGFTWSADDLRSDEWSEKSRRDCWVIFHVVMNYSIREQSLVCQLVLAEHEIRSAFLISDWHTFNKLKHARAFIQSHTLCGCLSHDKTKTRLGKQIHMSSAWSGPVRFNIWAFRVPALFCALLTSVGGVTHYK